MIMYGGQNNGARGDIWAFDLDTDTWEELTPAASPDGRWFTAHAYDAANHRAIIFGGNAPPVVSDEVWAFDLTTEMWSEVFPSDAGPSHRAGATAVYDGANDRMVIFGGKGAAFYNEVWSLENLSDIPSAAGGNPPGPHARLEQNHPNPFNPNTVIGYEIPAAGRVTLGIYDVRGARVRVLVNESRPAGPQRVTWDGRDDSGAAVASGVYVYRLRYGDELLSKKLLLLK